MAAGRDFIVVLVGDAGLRTSLIARLGMTGRTVVTAHDRAELARWRELDSGSTLIIDASLLPSDRPVNAESLRAYVWSGRIFVIGGDRFDDAGDPPVRFVAPATATVDIMTNLANCP